MRPTLLQRFQDACHAINAAVYNWFAPLAGKLFWLIGIRSTDSQTVARLRVLYLCPLMLLLTAVVGVVRLAFWGTTSIIYAAGQVIYGTAEVLWHTVLTISELISIPFQRGWMQVVDAGVAWYADPAEEADEEEQ